MISRKYVVIGLAVVLATIAGSQFQFGQQVGQTSSSTNSNRLMTADELTALTKQYCAGCHNDTMKSGNMSLRVMDFAHV